MSTLWPRPRCDSHARSSLTLASLCWAVVLAGSIFQHLSVHFGAGSLAC